MRARPKVGGSPKKVKASIILTLKAQERDMVLHKPPGGNPKTLPILGQSPKPRRRHDPPKETGQDLLQTDAWTIQILPLPPAPPVWRFWAQTLIVWIVKTVTTSKHIALSHYSKTWSHFLKDTFQDLRVLSRRIMEIVVVPMTRHLVQENVPAVLLTRLGSADAMALLNRVITLPLMFSC